MLEFYLWCQLRALYGKLQAEFKWNMYSEIVE